LVQFKLVTTPNISQLLDLTMHGFLCLRNPMTDTETVLANLFIAVHTHINPQTPRLVTQIFLIRPQQLPPMVPNS